MPRTSPHPTAEACRALVLDSNQVMRPAVEARRRDPALGAAEAGMRINWTRRGEAAVPWAAVDIALWLDAGPYPRAEAVLRYVIPHTRRPAGAQVQRVTLAWTPCHYGGRRWYWICPATGRNVRYLYLPDGGTRFLSRAAYRLRWPTTCATPLEKNHLRLRRLAKKLGAEYGCFTTVPPPRPKRMRWWTYERLVAEWAAAAGRHDAVWAAGARRTLRRFGLAPR